MRTRCCLLPTRLAAIAAAVCLVGSAHARELVLVDEGRARCAVVVPDEADSFTKMAAGWLVDYVQRATGTTLPIVGESESPDDISLIFVGHPRGTGADTSELRDDGCRMRVDGRTLHLYGIDSPVRGSAVAEPKTGPWLYHWESGQSRRALAVGAKGTCRAVTRFLETFCGVRWLMPATEGVVAPKRDRLAVPADLDVSFNPAFSFYIGSAFYRSQLSHPESYANNTRSSVRIRHYGGHSYIHWLSPAEFEEHPEYFVLHNGARSNVGHHVCPSNESVRRILLRGLQQTFDDGYDWVELGQSDGHVPCRCDACLAMTEDDGRRMLLLHKWICDEVARSHPDNTVLLLAYGPTGKPRSDVPFGRNVVVEVTGAGQDRIEAWKGFGRGMTVYHYWFDDGMGMGWGPKMTPQEAAQMVHYYRDNNVIGIFGGGGRAWGLIGPTYYVLGRMMGDPALDHRQLVSEYCDGLYGAASQPMQAFYELLYSRKYWHLAHRRKLRWSIEESIVHLFPPKVIHGLEERLRRAEAAADSERARAWVRTTRDEFDYLRHMSRMLHLYRAYLVDENAAIRRQLHESVNGFNTWRQRIVRIDGERALNYHPGHGYLAKFLTTGANSGWYYDAWHDLRDKTDYEGLDRTGIGFSEGSSLNEPITLDFDAARPQRAFHLVQAPSPPTIDGKLDETAWAGAPATRIDGATPTHVRGLYDGENLYLAYECEEPMIDKLNVQDLYRDGEVSLMDCVEFMVAPESATYATRYYHFLVAPAKDAVMDLRTGFRSGRDQDESWNADGLKIGYRIDKAGKRWSIEMMIPLADLRAAAPRSGDVWMGNLARERRIDAVELQLWSQGGDGGFTDPKAFGSFVFD